MNATNAARYSKETEANHGAVLAHSESTPAPQPGVVQPIPLPAGRDDLRGPAKYLQFALRLPQIAAVSLTYGLAYLVRSLGKSRESKLRLRGRFVLKYLTSMGPLYMKMGQALATRSDLLPPEIIEALKTLHDDCPPCGPAYVSELLKAEQISQARLFGSFEYEPIASGSIAQVHKATLADGQVVAVKIVKAGVRRQLHVDLALIRAILAVCQSILRSVREADAAAHFKEIETLLVAQADMHLEAANQMELGAKFDGHPFIVVPRAFPNLSTRSVLIMEFIEGTRGHDISADKERAAKIAERLQHAVYTMLYMGGLYHADPHPGNVFFTDNDRVAFVDFGVVGRLGEDEKWGLSSFFFACSREEWRLASARFVKHFVRNADAVMKQWGSFEPEFSKVLQNHFQWKTDRWSTFNFVSDASRVLSQFGARFATNFTQVAFMFLVGEGFVTQIDPEVDIWKNARIFTDRFSPYMSADVRARFDREIAEPAVKGRALRQRAAEVLVAPTHLDRYFLPSRYPLFVKKAYGSRLEDVDGQVYIDLSCGYGPHILGYAKPEIVAAINLAAENGCVNAIGHSAEITLANDLVHAFPGAERCILANSGTEAVIQAVRLCKTFRKAEWIAKFEGHYHGFSDQGLISSWFRYSGPPDRPQPIAPPGVQRAVQQQTLILPYGNAETFELLRERQDDLACVLCEPMPAVLADYDEAFLRALSAHCRELNIPLVFDEVVSGFRVAYGGVQTRIGVTPDLTCLGKIIGGGLPCGAVVGRGPIVELAKTSGDPFTDFDEKTFVGGTMSGNSLSCSAGVAMLAYLRWHPEIYTELEAKTEWLRRKFVEVAQHLGIQFFMKGRCSIFSMTFGHRKARSTREQHAGSNFKANLALSYYMRKHGVYMPELHTMMLSAAHSYDDLSIVIQAFEASLTDMLQDGFFIS